MKRLIPLLLLLLAPFAHAKEKYFVVERNDSAFAVIQDHRLKGRIEDLHNFNHAVAKFQGRHGFVITRDGYVIKFDPLAEKKLKEYKSSRSAIGFTLGDRYLAVANYDNRTVQILDFDLNPLQTFETGSKNVGIKVYRDRLVFALMDKDALWVLRDTRPQAPRPRFERIKVFEDVGVAPFDAMINGKDYIVGFFRSPHVGVLDLETLTYRKVPLRKTDDQPVLKVPHFGFWSISGERIFIPAVGDNKVFVYTPDFRFVAAIEVAGLPVFTSLSPDRRFLAVTFSGKDFPRVQIVDTHSLKVVQDLRFSGKVLHLRWSQEEPLLYVSNNTGNTVVGVDTRSWEPLFRIPVRHPSGIFLYRY